MTRNLTTRILLRAKRKEATRREKNYAAFFVQREQIKQSLADGWAVMNIWETLRQEGKITASYVTFSRQVKRWIRTAKEQPVSRTVVIPAIKARSAEIDGFIYEATSNQEDLL